VFSAEALALADNTYYDLIIPDMAKASSNTSCSTLNNVQNGFILLF